MGAIQVELAVDAVTGQEPDDPHDDPVEFGWRVHGLLGEWTGKVDSKASIVLAIESAGFAFVVTQTNKGRVFAGLDGWQLWGLRVALGCLILAVALSLLVVLPQLNRKQSKRDWKSNTIYFGHLRHWNPGDLAKAMMASTTQPDQLARQMVAMSKIAWRKHAWLQGSLALLALAVLVLLAVAID
jgi:Family of unknown function (DUF5706)